MIAAQAAGSAPATSDAAPPRAASGHIGFRRFRLPRSGKRPAVLHAADIWSGRVETAGREGAVIRHEARLLVDVSGDAFLHLVGQRLVDGAVVAWHGVLAEPTARMGLASILDAYDPARLISGFDDIAWGLDSDREDAWRAFAEEATRVKTDLCDLVERLGRPARARR